MPDAPPARARSPPRALPRPAGRPPSEAHTRRSSCRSPLATQVRCCEARGTRCIEARFNRSGAPTSARARAHVRPNLPVSEPSSGLLTKYGSNPDLSPTPTCALNPDSPCPYPLRTGRPYTRTSCVRPLYAGPLARSHSAGPAFARHVTLRVESVSPHRPRRRCGMLYILCTRCLLRDFCRISLSFCPVIHVGVINREQYGRARGRKQTNFARRRSRL